MVEKEEQEREATVPGPDGATALGSGARWGVLATGVLQLSTVASAVVPAHFLAPDQFALVGAATVVSGLFGVVAEAGFGDALIAGDSDDRVRISSTFWTATGVGLVLAVVVAITSGWTSRLLGSPEAAPYIAALGTLLPISMAVSVLQAIHFRRLDHRVAFVAQIAQAIVSAVVPIALVVAGVGPWALVIGRLAGAAAAGIVLVVVGRVVPSLTFDRREAMADLAFNGGQVGGSVVSYAAKNLDYWALGGAVSQTAFGGYYVAYVIPQIIRQRGTWLGRQLLFPVLARIRDQPELFRERYLEALQVVSVVVMPALVGIAVCADLVVELVFGSGWDLAIAPLRILSVASSLDIISHSSNSAFLARRETAPIVRLQLLRLGALAAGLVSVPITHDVRAAAYAVLGSVIVGCAGTMYALARRDIVGPGAQLRALVPVVVPTVLMAVAVLGFRVVLGPDANRWVRLVAMVLVGVSVYLGTGFAMFNATYRSFASRARQIARPGGPRR